MCCTAASNYIHPSRTGRGSIETAAVGEGKVSGNRRRMGTEVEVVKSCDIAEADHRLDDCNYK